jgi:hypothetical protein
VILEFSGLKIDNHFIGRLYLQTTFASCTGKKLIPAKTSSVG